MTSGSGAFGCARSSASGTAQASATYSAFLEATSSIQNTGCPCLNQVFAESFASAEVFGDVWAKVSGSVEATVCSSGMHTPAPIRGNVCRVNKYIMKVRVTVFDHQAG